MARKSRKNNQSSNKALSKPKEYAAGLYARISVGGDDADSSIETQLFIMRNFIDVNLDISEYREYTDIGVSSFDFVRPAFADMLNDVCAKKINCIIVKDISRFGCDYLEVLDYITKIFPKLGVRFISITEQFDSLYDDPTKLTIALLSLFSYHYSKEISAKAKAVIAVKQRDGTYIPPKMPYGYTKKRVSGRVEWDINQAEARVVNQIFENANHGSAPYTIAGMLNSQNIPSPNGKYWSASSIYRILNNSVYIGEFIVGKTKSELLTRRKIIKLPKDEWIYHKNHHVPIINESLFKSVQDIVTPYRSILIEKRIKTQDFFKGKLYCGNCGRKLKRKTANNGSEYYVCYAKDETAGVCSNKSINSKKIKSLIFAAIQNKIAEAKRYKEEAIIFEQSLYYKNWEYKLNVKLSKLRRKLKEQDELFVKIFEKHTIKGDVMSADFQGLLRHFSNVKNYTALQIKEIEDSQRDYRENKSPQAEWIQKYMKYSQCGELTQNMTDELAEKIYFSNGEIKIVYKAKKGEVIS